MTISGTTASITVRDLNGDVVGSGYGTLKQAVEAANKAGGGTIAIGHGEVDVTMSDDTDPVEVTHRVTIFGAGEGATKLVARAEPTGGAMIVVSDGARLDVKHLTIDGNNAELGPDGQDIDLDQAILFDGGSGLIRHVTFRNIMNDDAVPDMDETTEDLPGGTAIQVQDGSGGKAQNLVVIDTSFESVGLCGIRAQDEDTRLVVDGMSFTGTGVANSRQYGIFIHNGADAEIRNSTFSGLAGGAGGDSADSAAILITDSDATGVIGTDGAAPTVSISALTVSKSNVAVAVMDLNANDNEVTVAFGHGIEVNGNGVNQHKPSYPLLGFGDLTFQGDVIAYGAAGVNGNFRWEAGTSIVSGMGKVMQGGRLTDFLQGGDGNDHIWGGGMRDWLLGGEGNDMIRGGLGNDGLDGGDGSDVLVGGRGNDHLYGDSGSDLFVFRQDGGHDFLDEFEVGIDMIDLTRVKGLDRFEDIVQKTNADGDAVAVIGDLVITFWDETWATLDRHDFLI